jgi:hypothetical protein
MIDVEYSIVDKSDGRHDPRGKDETGKAAGKEASHRFILA